MSAAQSEAGWIERDFRNYNLIRVWLWLKCSRRSDVRPSWTTGTSSPLLTLDFLQAVDADEPYLRIQLDGPPLY